MQHLFCLCYLSCWWWALTFLPSFSFLISWIWLVLISLWWHTTLPACRWGRNSNCDLHPLLCWQQRGENGNGAQTAHEAPKRSSCSTISKYMRHTHGIKHDFCIYLVLDSNFISNFCHRWLLSSSHCTALQRWASSSFSTWCSLERWGIHCWYNFQQLAHMIISTWIIV